MPDTKYICCPMCFAPDTLVSVNNDLIPINQLDSSIDGIDKDARKKSQPILQHFTRPYDGKVIRLKIRYLPPVMITPEHPILIKHLQKPYHRQTKHRMSGWPTIWKKACNLSPGDFVLIPREFYHPKWQYLDFRPFRGKKAPKSTIEMVRLDEIWAELLGWYLAEGHTSPKEIVLSLGKHEVDNIKRIRELAQQIGYSSYISQNTAIQIHITSRVLARAFAQWFGKGARNKRVPDFIMRANLLIRKAFLKAYFAGDGHFDMNRGRYIISSASDRLIRQIQLLYLQLGICLSYEKTKRGGLIDGRVLPKTDKYILEGENSKKYALLTKRFVYLAVHKAEEVEYQDRVFNVQTRDGTYQVPFIVHNCGWWRTSPYGENKQTGEIREVRFDRVDPATAPMWQKRRLRGTGKGSKNASIETLGSKTLEDLPEEMKEQIRRQCHRILDVLE